MSKKMNPYDEGYKAATDGESIKTNPYDAHFEARSNSEWVSGWNDGDETAQAKERISREKRGSSLQTVKQLLMKKPEEASASAEAPLASNSYQHLFVGKGESVVDGESHWNDFVRVHIDDPKEAFTLAMEILHQVEAQQYRAETLPISFSLTGSLKSEEP